ncbi:MAG: thiamine diphosphokinase, partial [Anaerolineae bacterium]
MTLDLTVIMANGEFHANEPLRALWQQAALRIAADGGARNARRALEIPPQIVIGDLDSLDEETRVWLQGQPVEFIRHPVAKDETDLELAILLAYQRGAGRVIVLGALGGRADQAVANVLLLTRWPGLALQGIGEEMWVAQNQATIHGAIGDTVSLIPLDSRVEGITTHNLVYPLKNEPL